MKALQLLAPGDRTALQLVELPLPEICAPDQVRVRVCAAGINPIDIKLRKKGSFFPQNLPVIPGCEGSGFVDEIGKNVTRFSKGDPVMFMNGGFGETPGTFADYTIVPEWALSHKPDNKTTLEAACIPLTLITAWEALHFRGQIKSTDQVLIHAGAGGVGHMAIQLARLTGARVYTTVRGEDKKELILRENMAIPLDAESFAPTLLKMTAGQGVDLVIDTVGRDVTGKSLEVLSPYGRMITLLEEKLSETDVIIAKKKNITLHWIQALMPSIEKLQEQRIRQTRILETGKTLSESGLLSVRIMKSFKPADVGEAQDMLENGHPWGRIALDFTGR